MTIVQKVFRPGIIGFTAALVMWGPAVGGIAISGLSAPHAFAYSGVRPRKAKPKATPTTGAGATTAPGPPAAGSASHDGAVPGETAAGDTGKANADPPAGALASSASPTIVFTLKQPGGHPQEFTVSVHSTGLATYNSCNVACPGASQLTAAEAVSAEMANSAGEDPYWRNFNVSEKTREHIFSLAQSVNYFDGDFDYTKHRIANTGTKTLGYSDGARKTHTTYNWSENQEIQELTNFFLGISATQEGGRRLLFLQRFDKLGLEAELKSLQSLSHENRLAEVEAITPVLQTIIADRAVMHVTRQRAQKLLDTTVTGKPADVR